MSRPVFVHYLPTMFAPEELRGGVAVVIDILRASTTIAQALAAGAETVIPCGEVGEAQSVAANLSAGSYLLGGERGGVKIAGFDLGNSPLEYTPERIAGKTLVFTTTNGTRALKRCECAERILIGSFANLTALAQTAGPMDLPVHLVCAGTDGFLSSEDVLFAGAVVAELEQFRGPEILRENDANRMACELYRLHSAEDSRFLEALKESRGGRNLMDLGYEADIQWAAERNRFNTVPEYHRKTGRIETAAS